ncbi:MAG TPA: type II toxin-antitoxin system VapB family antitoxin [Thermoanaerobaculia bacterium]|jgi:Arc/MetJ family transcription regulator
MRTNVVLDDDLVREAFRLTGVRTKRELIHTALQELVRARRKKDLTELAGRIRFRKGFDHKTLREMRHGSR